MANKKETSKKSNSAIVELSSFDDSVWRAKSDARTMADYQQIISDKKRMAAAIKEAKSQAQDLEKRASAMSKVAKTK